MDKSPFCEATGNLCFGLQLTLPVKFKVRVDAPCLACAEWSLESTLHVQASAQTSHLSLAKKSEVFGSFGTNTKNLVIISCPSCVVIQPYHYLFSYAPIAINSSLVKIFSLIYLNSTFRLTDARRWWLEWYNQGFLKLLVLFF